MGRCTSKLRLRNVLYAPQMGVTLVSVGCIDADGYSALFSGGRCQIRNGSGEIVGEILRSGGLYKVEHGHEVAAHAAQEEVTLEDLHRRLGHASAESIQRLVRNGVVTGVKLVGNSDLPLCDSCVFAKTRRKPVPKARSSPLAPEVGDRVHTNVWGPAPVATLGGRRYYVSFTDDRSRYTAVYLIRNKSDVRRMYSKFRAWIKSKFKRKIGTLQSDRGGEYLADELQELLDEDGTHHQTTVHDTPEENGVAERLNGVLLGMVRAMLHDATLPKSLWGEAVLHAVWLGNRMTTRPLGRQTTPYEAVFGAKPDISKVHAFGCHVWVHDTSGSKLDGRAREGRWVGFDHNSQGHRIYWAKTRTVTVERTVIFRPGAGATLEGENEEPTTPESIAEPSPPVPETIEPRPSRTRKPSAYVQRILEGENISNVPAGIRVETAAFAEDMHSPGGGARDEWAMAVATADAEGLEPRTLAEAKRRPDWPRWEEAIQEELGRLDKAGTWELVEKPEDANIVGSKWVFKIKKNAAGDIEKYRARLVAQGFTQVPGIDYFDTFAPVAKLTSIRSILAIAARNGWPVHQMDVKSAYLYGKLDEDERIFMAQPPGYHVPNSVGKVLRLRKAIYGLKQSGRRWYQTFWGILVEVGLMRCEVDHAVFYIHFPNGDIVLLGVHVDDLTLTASTDALLHRIKSHIWNERRAYIPRSRQDRADRTVAKSPII